MRYRTICPKKGTAAFCTPKAPAPSISQQLADVLAQVFRGSAAGFRLVGHSLGTQLAVHATTLLMQRQAREAEAAEEQPGLGPGQEQRPAIVLPTRIALLDVFGTLGIKAYLSGWPIMAVVQRELVALRERGIVLEQYQSSLIGRRGLWFRHLTVFIQLDPAHIPWWRVRRGVASSDRIGGWCPCRLPIPIPSRPAPFRPIATPTAEEPAHRGHLHLLPLLRPRPAGPSPQEGRPAAGPVGDHHDPAARPRGRPHHRGRRRRRHAQPGPGRSPRRQQLLGGRQRQRQRQHRRRGAEREQQRRGRRQGGGGSGDGAAGAVLLVAGRQRQRQRRRGQGQGHSGAAGEQAAALPRDHHPDHSAPPLRRFGFCCWAATADADDKPEQQQQQQQQRGGGSGSGPGHLLFSVSEETATTATTAVVEGGGVLITAATMTSTIITTTTSSSSSSLPATANALLPQQQPLPAAITCQHHFAPYQDKRENRNHVRCLLAPTQAGRRYREVETGEMPAMARATDAEMRELMEADGGYLYKQHRGHLFLRVSRAW